MSKRQNTWFYSGDVNLEHGGNYIKIESGYADIVRATDLDSGCGFTGACLIERLSVPIYGNLTGRKNIKSALESYGLKMSDLLQYAPEIRWHIITESLIGYGFYDTDSSETVQMQNDGPLSFDGWKCDKKLHGTNLKKYVESQYNCGE